MLEFEKEWKAGGGPSAGKPSVCSSQQPPRKATALPEHRERGWVSSTALSQ